MAGVLPVLLGGDANVYGMARSFYEAYHLPSVAVCKRALPALAHSRFVRPAVQDPLLEQDAVFTARLTALAREQLDIDLLWADRGLPPYNAALAAFLTR